MTLDPTKLIIVAIVALIVLGPDKLPVLMRQSGRYWNTFKSIRETVQGEVNSAMSTIADSTGLARTSASETVTQVRNSIETLKGQLASSTAFINPFAVGTTPSGDPVPLQADQQTMPPLSGSQPMSPTSQRDRALSAPDGAAQGYPFLREVGEQAYRPGCPELN